MKTQQACSGTKLLCSIIRKIQNQKGQTVNRWAHSIHQEPRVQWCRNIWQNGKSLHGFISQNSKSSMIVSRAPLYHWIQNIIGKPDNIRLILIYNGSFENQFEGSSSFSIRTNGLAHRILRTRFSTKLMLDVLFESILVVFFFKFKIEDMTSKEKLQGLPRSPRRKSKLDFFSESSTQNLFWQQNSYWYDVILTRNDVIKKYSIIK